MLNADPSKVSELSSPKLLAVYRDFCLVSCLCTIAGLASSPAEQSITQRVWGFQDAVHAEHCAKRWYHHGALAV
jgi:hypothetical protein